MGRFLRQRSYTQCNDAADGPPLWAAWCCYAAYHVDVPLLISAVYCYFKLFSFIPAIFVVRTLARRGAHFYLRSFLRQFK